MPIGNARTHHRAQAIGALRQHREHQSEYVEARQLDLPVVLPIENDQASARVPEIVDDEVAVLGQAAPGIGAQASSTLDRTRGDVCKWRCVEVPRQYTEQFAVAAGRVRCSVLRADFEKFQRGVEQRGFDFSTGPTATGVHRGVLHAFADHDAPAVARSVTERAWHERREVTAGAAIAFVLTAQIAELGRFDLEELLLACKDADRERFTRGDIDVVRQVRLRLVQAQFHQHIGNGFQHAR